jgi:hypothetical protein
MPPEGMKEEELQAKPMLGEKKIQQNQDDPSIEDPI